jgi:hypothetical protein
MRFLHYLLSITLPSLRSFEWPFVRWLTSLLNPPQQRPISALESSPKRICIHSVPQPREVVGSGTGPRMALAVTGKSVGTAEVLESTGFPTSYSTEIAHQIGLSVTLAMCLPASILLTCFWGRRNKTMPTECRNIDNRLTRGKMGSMMRSDCTIIASRSGRSLGMMFKLSSVVAGFAWAFLSARFFAVWDIFRVVGQRFPRYVFFRL